MVQELIFVPMSVLAFWTLFMLLLTIMSRVRAMRRGLARPIDFRYGESGTVPPDSTLPHRNYMNLLELPMLFYVVCVASYAMKQADGLTFMLASAFVGSRILHSLIHITYNNVLHRTLMFGVGVTILLLMWLRLLLSSGFTLV
jgi:hypothetical protein